MTLRSSLLSQLPWVEHGFGTRNDALSQDGMAGLEQVHSSAVLVADRFEGGRAGTGDALITNRSGLAVSVRTADCFPILLADVRNHAVAAVHAGWRGTAARIVVEALGRMRDQFGTSPEDVYAAIGPGIGVCCYEVGGEVARQFGLDQPGNIDLAGHNRRQLLEAGVRETHIDTLSGCTFCDAARFHSFRREKESAGRMISFIRAH